MKHTYTFKISGMTCHACEKLITMDLKEAGFTPNTITHDPGTLTISIDETEVGRVKAAIEASKTYTVTTITKAQLL